MSLRALLFRLLSTWGLKKVCDYEYQVICGDWV